MTDLFSEKRWTGEFFPPNRHEDRFSGELTVSFQNGISLMYIVPGPQDPPQCAYLHGVVSSGDRCTLIGDFPLGRPGFNLRNGLASRCGKSGFPFLILGGFFSPETEFSEVSFTIAGLKNFFGTQGFEDFVKVSQDAIYAVEASFGKLEVRHAASFSSAPSDITALIHSFDSKASDALKQKFDEVEQEFPNAHFMIKKNLSYRFRLLFKSRENASEAFKYVAAISDLFTLFSYEPVFPSDIKLADQDDQSNFSYELHPYNLVSDDTLEMCRRSHAQGRPPIEEKDVPLATVLKNWLAASDSYNVIISSIRGQTGLTNLHQTYGEIVLHATQLEAVAYEAKQKKKKYEYPVAKYASPRTKDALNRIFNTGAITDVGVAIGDLRNELAHVGRPKIWLAKLQLPDLILLSQCLEMTILGYVMEKLEVPQKAVFAYQDSIIPSPR